MHYLNLKYSKVKQAWVLSFAGRILGEYTHRGDAEAEMRRFGS